jgi:antitoxin VapB
VAAKVAKVFKNGRSQAVRIPKEFRLDTDEVLIERKGKQLVLTPRVARRWRTWAEYFANLDPLPDDFPDYIPDPPPKPIKGW